MSTVDSLVRLHRWQLDERRRQLADLDQLAQKLQLEAQRLVDEEKAEQRIAGHSAAAAAAYPNYGRHLIERREKLQQSLSSVEQQTLLAREALAEAYQEVKRYETAAANRLLQQHKRLLREQQRSMDEIGLQAFSRRTPGH